MQGAEPGHKNEIIIKRSFQTSTITFSELQPQTMTKFLEKKKSTSRSDEESINFRPSPNFKHMKKYLKSKFEEANQMANLSSSNEVSDSSSSSHDEREKVNNNSTQVIQPPLPPNPPPESPPLINLKKEIVDEEYSSIENPSDFNQSDVNIAVTNIKTDQSEAPKKPEVTMCRNFARGTCRKGASCIFAHELILSQLPGVYTFCRNFQNSVCTLPKCKFVHATVFEKEYFFRTGQLPPHTLSHLTEGSVQQQPSPLPPPEETQIEGPPAFVTDPLLELSMPCIVPAPELSCATGPSVHENAPQLFGDELELPTSTKREWSDIDEFCSSPSDLDSSEPLAKICKNCDKNEFRLQIMKNKAEKCRETSEEVSKKATEMNIKMAKLAQIMSALFNPRKPTKFAKVLNTPMIMTENKEVPMAEKVKLILAARSAHQKEDKKQLFSNSMLANNANFTELLAKFIVKNAEKKLPPPEDP